MEKGNSRRDFIKQVSVTGAAMAAGALASCAGKDSANAAVASTTGADVESKLIVPKAQGLKITGTFVEEISHDIPHGAKKNGIKILHT